MDGVTAKLMSERYKAQVKSKELEKQLLVEQAERKNILLFFFWYRCIFISYFGCYLSIKPKETTTR